MKPTEEELKNLKTVLVRDNKIITGVKWAEDIRGRGGSNCSAPYNDCMSIKTVEELAGTEIKKEKLSGMGFYSLSFAILAVVDDVIYLGKYGDGCEIYEVTSGKPYQFDVEIAYDTQLIFTLSAVTK